MADAVTIFMQLHVAILRFLDSQVFLSHLTLSFCGFCFFSVVIFYQFKKMDLNLKKNTTMVSVQNRQTQCSFSQISLAVKILRNEVEKSVIMVLEKCYHGVRKVL